jgi:hypothetical protein
MASRVARDPEARLTLTVTPAERDKIPDLRARVADLPDPDGHTTDRDLVRFLRARGGDVGKASQMLRKHLLWRAETRPRRTHCAACEETPGFHPLRQVGYDNAGRPVVLTCFAQTADGKGFRCGAAHMIYAIENAIATATVRNARIGVEYDGLWVW